MGCVFIWLGWLNTIMVCGYIKSVTKLNYGFCGYMFVVTKFNRGFAIKCLVWLNSIKGVLVIWILMVWLAAWQTHMTACLVAAFIYLVFVSNNPNNNILNQWGKKWFEDVCSTWQILA